MGEYFRGNTTNGEAEDLVLRDDLGPPIADDTPEGDEPASKHTTDGNHLTLEFWPEPLSHEDLEASSY